jgi:cytochrome c-type biogenesis protein
LLANVSDQLSTWWAPALAFLAGFVSFASPCVLPLVPGYLSFVTGENVTSAATVQTKTRLLPILLFIGGFTVVFTLYGAFASTFAKIFFGTAGQVIAGTIVALLGVVMILYAFQRGPMAIYAERRPFMERVDPGVAGAFPLGMAFAAGWTPCIGPVLGGILAIAAAQSAARGVILLVCYSLGLGVPFLLLGLGVQWLTGTLGWMRRHFRAIGVVSGALLVILGILIATREFTRLVAPLQRYVPGL